MPQKSIAQRPIEAVVLVLRKTQWQNGHKDFNDKIKRCNFYRGLKDLKPEAWVTKSMVKEQWFFWGL